MPLGTLDRTPPPFFRQGFSARSKLAFFSALAIFLMVADNRFQVVRPARAALATALLPVQRVLAVPVDLWHGSGDYLRSLQQAQAAERQAQERLAALAERTARAEQLAQENVRLRALLELRPAIAVRSLPAEVMYEAADPFSRKVFIDRGATHGVVPGSPVINEAGVLGQVTQVYALNAEVTLLTDKDAAIPVLNTRTQQRSAAFGGGAGGMELRFMSGNADVQVGDRLHTDIQMAVDAGMAFVPGAATSSGRRVAMGSQGLSRSVNLPLSAMRCPAAHQWPGRRLPAGTAGGARGRRRTARGSGLRAHHARGGGTARWRASRAGAGTPGAAVAAAAGSGARGGRAARRAAAHDAGTAPAGGTVTAPVRGGSR